MDIRTATTLLALLTLGAPLGAAAQQGEAAAAQAPQEKPEEMIVTGDRSHFLRRQMQEAHEEVYDIFNSFNDEKRFEVSCGIQQPTGRHLTNQLCQPAFVRQASTVHAQGYLANLYSSRNPENLNPQHPPQTAIPYEAAVMRHQRDYRRKLQQIAEEHPEFRDALQRYGELRAAYEGEQTGSE